MGNCLISIHVTGTHHNGKKTDIDQLAAEFVDSLKAQGHYVTSATVVSGGEYDLLDVAHRFPVSD